MVKKGEDAFEKYYQNLFGDRWPRLKESLLSPKKNLTSISLGHEKQGEKQDEKQNEKQVEKNYFLDRASLAPVFALELQGHEKVLDLCAAPGGKSLAIIKQLTTGHLTANDRSNDRRLRMLKNLRDFVSVECHHQFKVTGLNASKWCLYEKEAYDKILLDAPCSSERHVLNDPKYLKDWGESRIKYLAKEQWAILASALQVVKVGGRIVYSTCALNNIENDGIIDKLLKKRKSRVKIIDFKFKQGEKTEFGYHILPDTNNGDGPIYFSVIERIA